MECYSPQHFKSRFIDSVLASPPVNATEFLKPYIEQSRESYYKLVTLWTNYTEQVTVYVASNKQVTTSQVILEMDAAGLEIKQEWHKQARRLHNFQLSVSIWDAKTIPQ